MSPKITNALISVSDKSGLTEFAQCLAAAGITIYSTGGTRRHLEEAGLTVRDVSEYTQFPEMMNGRLKTLHPKIFGGILCRHDRDDDMQGLSEHGIETFELVVVNLYPFEQTIAKQGVTEAEAIEQIDIGGPSLVRAAAKNHKFTTIATTATQYNDILKEIEDNGSTSLKLRKQLASDAFRLTAEYDSAISKFYIQSLSENPKQEETFPELLLPGTFQKQTELRYGENPHQQAAVYQSEVSLQPNLVKAKQLNGKELSYNNLLDLDAAISIVRSLPQPSAAVLKHNNPCGAATAATLGEAMKLAMEGDPVSAFGSIVGLNQPCDAATAEVLATPGNFIEAVVAPSFEADALEILTTKPKWKANVRLLEVGPIEAAKVSLELRYIAGGVLVQQSDTAIELEDDWKVMTDTKIKDDQLMQDLRFAWQIVRHVKSNAIVVCGNGSLVGAGAGQMSRVDSVEIAIKKAGDRVQGAVMASDAFFPFDDSIHHAAKVGIKAIIQPGGSRRDDEVIAACNQHGLAMIFTGQRHFKH